MIQSGVERTAMQNSAIRNSCWQKYSSSDVNTILLTNQIDIYSGHTENPKKTQAVDSTDIRTHASIGRYSTRH